MATPVVGVFWRHRACLFQRQAPALDHVIGHLHETAVHTPSDANLSTQVNRRVMARFAGGDTWFQGRVAWENDDRTFAVAYDDGDFEASVKRSHVKSLLPGQGEPEFDPEPSGGALLGADAACDEGDDCPPSGGENEAADGATGASAVANENEIVVAHRDIRVASFFPGFGTFCGVATALTPRTQPIVSADYDIYDEYSDHRVEKPAKWTGDVTAVTKIQTFPIHLSRCGPPPRHILTFPCHCRHTPINTTVTYDDGDTMELNSEDFTTAVERHERTSMLQIINEAPAGLLQLKGVNETDFTTVEIMDAPRKRTRVSYRESYLF